VTAGRLAVTARRRDDSGQTTLLILIYSLIVLAVAFTGVSVTAVHLTRHRLAALADGAALDAADALDQQRFYAVVGGAGPAPDRVVSLSQQSVRSSVTAYLSASPLAERIGDVRVSEPTTSPDGSTAEVTLTTSVKLPLLSGLGIGPSGGITVTATGRARARQIGAG
jgi:hypothetical protein